MLHGPMVSGILKFALPFAASSILQQMFNAVDVAVVGRFASSEALAAVGANTFLINLFINLFVGISVGLKSRAQAHSLVNGVFRDFKVEVVSKQRVKLHTQQPPLGKQCATVFYVAER